MNSARLERVRREIERRKLDAFVVFGLKNIFYLSGFTGSTAVLVVTKDKPVILVDPRYTIQSSNECGAEFVREFRGKPQMAALAELLGDLRLRKIGYESAHITVGAFNLLRHIADSSVSFKGVGGIVESMRAVKDASEIEVIKRAAKIADDAFDYIAKTAKIGMSENEAAIEIDFAMRRLGAQKESFDTIAASGPNSACPHHSPTSRKIQKGDFLKLDFGPYLDNYAADITRTVVFGRPSAKQEEVYDIVLEAQLAAINAIRPGVAGRDIDKVARDYIGSRGYGDNFGHGLGHSIGIDVHDGPGFSPISDITLAPGMVMSVEPGIYIEGWGGVRIEDDIVVTETGCEVITRATKDLLNL